MTRAIVYLAESVESGDVTATLAYIVTAENNSDRQRYRSKPRRGSHSLTAATVGIERSRGCCYLRLLRGCCSVASGIQHLREEETIARAAMCVPHEIECMQPVGSIIDAVNMLVPAAARDVEAHVGGAVRSQKPQ